MLDLSRKHDRATELRAIADGRLLLNVRNGVTVSRSMLAKIADEIDALRATITPAEVGGLVERLRNPADRYCTQSVREEAASLIQSQAARIAELEVGLEPFADVADHDIGSDEADDDVFRPMTNHNSAAKITVGHMRRTVALLNKDQPHD